MFKRIKRFLGLGESISILIDLQQVLIDAQDAKTEQTFHVVASLDAQDVELNKQTEQIFHVVASLDAQDQKLNKQTEHIFHIGASLDSQDIELNKQTEQIFHIGASLDAQDIELNKQTEQIVNIGASVDALKLDLNHLKSQLKSIEEKWEGGFSSSQLAMLNPRLRRNFLPNDDAIMHKYLMTIWQASSLAIIGYKELLESSFRVFSQNDEDGMLLRIFSHIGQLNQYVIEIGSNCSESDLGIPENLSTNLIVNHGWHGAIFEIDQVECDKMQYFFARDYATKHIVAIHSGEQRRGVAHHPGQPLGLSLRQGGGLKGLLLRSNVALFGGVGRAALLSAKIA